MPDYQEMYIKLFRAAEQAVNLLIQAQRECEDLYISGSGAEIVELTREEPDEGPAR